MTDNDALEFAINHNFIDKRLINNMAIIKHSYYNVHEHIIKVELIDNIFYAVFDNNKQYLPEQLTTIINNQLKILNITNVKSLHLHAKNTNWSAVIGNALIYTDINCIDIQQDVNYLCRNRTLEYNKNQFTLDEYLAIWLSFANNEKYNTLNISIGISNIATMNDTEMVDFSKKCGYLDEKYNNTHKNTISIHLNDNVYSVIYPNGYIEILDNVGILEIIHNLYSVNNIKESEIKSFTLAVNSSKSNLNKFIECIGTGNTSKNILFYNRNIRINNITYTITDKRALWLSIKSLKRMYFTMENIGYNNNYKKDCI